jgi:hypothetical protein
MEAAITAIIVAASLAATVILGSRGHTRPARITLIAFAASSVHLLFLLAGVQCPCF